MAEETQHGIRVGTALHLSAAAATDVPTASVPTDAGRGHLPDVLCLGLCLGRCLPTNGALRQPNIDDILVSLFRVWLSQFSSLRAVVRVITPVWWNAWVSGGEVFALW